MITAVEILRHPTDEDWKRCKMLALNTIGKKSEKMPTEEWKREILHARHSPIRTLMFTIKMTIPYYVSVHFTRHKFGVEHYVTSQRNDRQDSYDRTKAPQDAPVVHIMDVNAEELMFIMRRRLCNQADPTTQAVAKLIRNKVLELNPEFSKELYPPCVVDRNCSEMYPCNNPVAVDFGGTY